MGTVPSACNTHITVQVYCCIQVYELEPLLRNAAITYPSYYLQAFHAYEEGNLGWLPAFEAEPATDIMAVRAIGDPDLTPAEAQQALRHNINGAIAVSIFR